MGRITVDMIRKRAEHNEGMISNLEELSLHQQHIEKIELLHKACRHLKILLLQSNLIHKIQNVHRLKELQYLNLALNNITKIQNLQRCESLHKLDLTMNFIPKQGLLTLHTLCSNEHLRDVYLMGNPCADWPGYRQYVIAKVPQLEKLDGKDIKPSQRIMAFQAIPRLEATLLTELQREGIDVTAAAQAEDDGLDYSSDMEVEDPGFVDPADGEFKRPWCPETRILEHRENERIEREQEEKKRAGQNSSPSIFGPKPSMPRWEDFPEIKEGEKVYQKNEGEWEFFIDESDDCCAIVLEVTLGKYMDTTLVKADVQPRWARLLIKGRLLQLRLPCDVKPDESAAQRSKASGRLVLTMPKQTPGREQQKQAPQPKRQQALKQQTQNVSEHARVAISSPQVKLHEITKQRSANKDGFSIKALRKAATLACSEADDDDDIIPPL